MAAPISPSNGFITRLLQQTTQNNTIVSQSGNTLGATKADQTSISPEARQANKGTANDKLESKLIELYNQNGRNKT